MVHRTYITSAFTMFEPLVILLVLGFGVVCERLFVWVTRRTQPEKKSSTLTRSVHWADLQLPPQTYKPVVRWEDVTRSPRINSMPRDKHIVDRGNRMWDGRSLGINDALISSSGLYELVQQSDGNLALYVWRDSESTIGWKRHFKWNNGVQLKLDSEHTVRLQLQGDGNLCTNYTTPTGSENVWCTGSATGDLSLRHALELDNNGRVYVLSYDPSRNMRLVHKFLVNSDVGRPGFIDL